MSLNPKGTSYNWNFSNPNNDGYCLELVGTVVSIQEVQHRDWDNELKRFNKPRFWSNGDPVFDIRIGIACPDGSLKTLQFAEAGKKQNLREKPSLHVDLFQMTNGNMSNIVGKTIHLVTWPEHPGEHPLLGYSVDMNGEQHPYPWNTDAMKGQRWGQGNPRLFGVEEIKDVKYELAFPLPDEYKVAKILADNGASGGQPATQQQPQMYGQFYAPPQTAQAQYPQYQQPVQQPVQQQYQQPAYRPQQQYQQPVMQQPMQPMQPMQPVPAQSIQMPQGMDPVVAAAMEAVGATNVQPVYNDIPF